MKLTDQEFTNLLSETVGEFIKFDLEEVHQDFLRNGYQYRGEIPDLSDIEDTVRLLAAAALKEFFKNPESPIAVSTGRIYIYYFPEWNQMRVQYSPIQMSKTFVNEKIV